MNFLAHCLLSGDDAEILIGNVMADFLKAGVEIPLATKRVWDGIHWHHKIDRFTDSHPLVAQSRRRLFPFYRHYSSVLVDLFYDNLLATHWEQFSDTPLPRFAQWVYDELEIHDAMLAPELQSRTPYMIADDWLCSYAREDGIRFALTRIELRASRPLDLSEAWDKFNDEKALYTAEFLEFFPQLVALMDEKLNAPQTQ